MGKQLSEKLEGNKGLQMPKLEEETQMPKSKRENYCYYSSYSDNGDYERRYINGDFVKCENRIYEEQINGKYTRYEMASVEQINEDFPVGGYDAFGDENDDYSMYDDISRDDDDDDDIDCQQSTSILEKDIKIKKLK
jgi:hypothetical protein